MQRSTDVVRLRPPGRHPRLGFVAALLAVLTVGSIAVAPRVVDAAEGGGWTTNLTASASRATPGQTVAVNVSVASSWSRSGLVDVEVHSNAGKVAQMYWDNQYFSTGAARTFSWNWAIPANSAQGTYTVKVGVFTPGWREVQHWSWSAATIEVTAGSTAPAPPAPAPAPGAPAGTYFSLRSPGAALPTEQQCANAVGWLREVRPENNGQNSTRGQASPSTPRATGNYTGTTEMIIRWGACKWGLDEDMFRAQLWQESEWRQSAAGDRTWHAGDPENCGAGQWPNGGFCAESVGLSQVRTRYYPHYNRDAPWTSTAYNVDVLGAELRACFNGEWRYPTYIFEQGYGAGDMDGCMGHWFSGDWRSGAAQEYIGAVYSKLWNRPWTRL